ncbi:hypothetical protein [Aliiroseovarius sediminis]|uniref:hypothetical protein n=1 Tax=Aliiroseovarius sediminis TaxID=2925839 RepID=UPI001F5A5482|nr:hypothetical protein [Aliiroseovarius sediminis]MCI2395753.1 hypothetical protein [Aliiroseovarius sediminis]
MTKVEKDLAPIYEISSGDQKPEPHIIPCDKIRDNRRKNKYNCWIDTGGDEIHVKAELVGKVTRSFVDMWID